MTPSISLMLPCDVTVWVSDIALHFYKTCIQTMPTISSLVQEKSLWNPGGVQVVRFGWMNGSKVAATKQDEKGTYLPTYLPTYLEQCV
jgi:hypothetical protein